MSLRPRYSLLTLFVLTALVAGGVKWWRGPHRVMMSNPPTAVERELLARAIEAVYMFDDMDFEYVYLQGWDTPEFLALIGRPRFGMIWTLAVHKETPDVKWQQQSNPYVVAVSPGRIIYSGKLLRQPSSAPPENRLNVKFEDCYLLTREREIYQLLNDYLRLNVKLVQLSDISDPIAREMISNELVKIAQEE